MGIPYSAALQQTRPSGHVLRDALWVYLILLLCSRPARQGMYYGMPFGYTLFCCFAADPPVRACITGCPLGMKESGYRFGVPMKRRIFYEAFD
ncbi:hypothetical protein EAI89_14420 [Eubacterium sp. am_0171]|nr:hypothetical protein EAI89_14420 [Eubacterium sp. am_0171]